MKQFMKRVGASVLAVTLLVTGLAFSAQAKNSSSYKIILPRKQITAYVGESVDLNYYVKTPSGRLAKRRNVKITPSDKSKVRIYKSYLSAMAEIKKTGNVTLIFRYKGAKAVMKVKIVSGGLRCPDSVGTKGYWYADGYGKAFKNGNYTVKSSNTKVLKAKKEGEYIRLYGKKPGKATLTVKTKAKTRKIKITVFKGEELIAHSKPVVKWNGKNIKTVSFKLKNNGSKNIWITHITISMIGDESYGELPFYGWFLKKAVQIKPGKTVAITFDEYEEKSRPKLKKVYGKEGFAYNIDGYTEKGTLNSAVVFF